MKLNKILMIGGLSAAMFGAVGSTNNYKYITLNIEEFLKS